MQGICTVPDLLSNSLAVMDLTNKNMGNSNIQISCPISPQLRVHVLWTQPQRLKGRLTQLSDELYSLFYSHYQFTFCFVFLHTLYLIPGSGLTVVSLLARGRILCWGLWNGNAQNKWECAAKLKPMLSKGLQLSQVAARGGASGLLRPLTSKSTAMEGGHYLLKEKKRH